MPLSREQRERYSRTLALPDFDEKDLERIFNTAIAVVGAGGLGSPALRLLTALGFGYIRIIDRDIVDLSNLQRQTIYNMEDIGRPKAFAAADNLRRMNPDVQFEPVTAVLDEQDAEELLEGCDIVIDGLDSIRARMAVNRAVQRLSIPYVYAGAIQYYANVSTLIPGKTACLECFMSGAEDSPENSCERLGVMPTVLSMAAAVQVQEAVCLATGRQPRLAGRLMAIDLSDLSVDTFVIARNEDCPVCSQQDTLQQHLKRPDRPTVTTLCSGTFSLSPPGKLSPDLSVLAHRLEGRYRVKVMTGFLQAIDKNGVQVTVMGRGNAIIKGANGPEEALKIYEDILREMHD